MAAALRDLAGSRGLFLTLVERQLRLRATRSLVSSIWPALAPVVLLMLYIYVFQTVFHVPIRHYAVFLFSGLLPWTFVAQSLGQSVTSLSLDHDVIRRARFAYELLPMASVVGLALYFLVTLTGFIVYLLLRGQLAISLLPVLIPSIAGLVLVVSGLSMVLSLIDVYNRDLRQVLANLLTIWFFFIPITYRPDMVDSRLLQMLHSIDPMSLIVGRFQEALYYGHIRQPAHLLLMTVTCVGWFLICLFGFRRLSSNLAKDV